MGNVTSHQRAVCGEINPKKSSDPREGRNDSPPLSVLEYDPFSHRMVRGVSFDRSNARETIQSGSFEWITPHRDGVPSVVWRHLRETVDNWISLRW